MVLHLLDGIPLTVNVIISNLMDFWLKNDTVTIDGKIYLFDYQGQLVKNKYGIVETPSMFHANTSTYRTNANGEVLTGKQIIDGKEYIFASKGQVVDGIIGYDSKLYLVTDSKIEKKLFWSPFFKKNILGRA